MLTFCQIIGFKERDSMPSLLDGRIDHYKNQYEKIASSRDSSQNGNLILDTTNDGNTSPAVDDFDYSQPVH